MTLQGEAGEEGAHVRKHRRGEAIDLHPIVDAVQDSLDRFQVIYEEHGDVVSALLDLRVNVEDLEDAVDKNETARLEAR